MNKSDFHQILKAVELRFNRGVSKKWRNKDFEDLSFEIHQKTKTLISPATLKRIFGKVKTGDDYHPQTNTTTALEQYSEWDKYVAKKRNNLVLILLGLTMGLIAIGFIIRAVLPENKQNKAESSFAQINLLKAEGTCPTTALFEYAIDENLKGARFHFGDKSKTVSINGSGKRSHFYAYPGYYDAHLQRYGKGISDTVKVLVPTNSWQSFAYYFIDDTTAVMRYYPIPIEPNVEDETFHAEPSALNSLGIDTTKIVSLSVSNYKKTGVNGDNFRYSALFKNDVFWPAIRCYSIKITIDGTEGRIEFKFTGEGCSTYSWFQLSEKFISGQEQDLSFLVIDPSDWVNIEIENNNQKIDLHVNQQNILSDSYSKSIGEILGTSIEFHGSGSVKSIILNTKNDEKIFTF